MAYRPPQPAPLRQGLASARERQKPIPQASAMIDIPRYYLFLSVAPIVVLFFVAIVLGWLNRERARNERNKVGFLRSLGYEERREVRGAVKEDDKGGIRRRNPGINPSTTPASGSTSNSKQTSTSTSTASARPLIIGFWHPYCNAGGGGERVLWTAIHWALRQQQDQGQVRGEGGGGRPRRRVVCVVYSGDYPGSSKEEILERVNNRFQIPLSSPSLSTSIHFLPLPNRRFISDGYWRRFTLLGQSLGSLAVCAGGVGVNFGVWGGKSFEGGVGGGFWPDVFIDTMGNPATLPLIAFLSGYTVPLGAYVHYPVISTDMIGRVRDGVWGVESGGEQGGKAGGLRGWRRSAKLAYYHLLTRAYAVSLLFADEIMTNSSWTSGHITRLLGLGQGTWAAYLLNMDRKFPVSPIGKPKNPTENGNGNGNGEKETNKNRTVFPPCDTSPFLPLPLENRHGSLTLISLAQFRPEKDHAKQLRALGILFAEHPEWRERGVRLVLMGSCRDEVDEAKVGSLKRLAEELGIEDSVEFVLNAPFPQIVHRLGQASIGLNTMKDEHFGISVVEFMAAGLIPLAHASAGPLMDIITPFEGQVTGFHAKSASEFAGQIHTILSLPVSSQLAIRSAARKQALQKFSTEEFETSWSVSWDRLLGEAEKGLEERRRVEMEEERRAR